MNIPTPSICHWRVKVAAGMVTVHFDVPGTEPGSATLSMEQVKNLLAFLNNPIGKKTNNNMERT